MPTDPLIARRSLQLETLAALRSQPLLVSQWPTVGSPQTFEDAVRAINAQEVSSDLPRLLRSAQAGLQMLTRPILAVLGELNAGKSSVIASFLSPAGRRRVPRGEENAQGTHRFVYWVPSSWLSDDACKASLLELLAAAHGEQIEFLSDDPATAAEQYRSGRDHLELLRVPLLASDPALDELGAAFLDCPDVQTRDRRGGPSYVESSSHGSSASGSPSGVPRDAESTRRENPRLGFVCDASRICSALLLVWDRVRIRDGLLADFLRSLRERKAEAPLYLLINKIRPERGQPARTRQDADLCQLLDEFQIGADHCYGAFDFDIMARREEPGWRELTPPSLVERHDADGGCFPQFFALRDRDAENVLSAIDESRFLWTLPSRLNLASLQRRKVDDQWHELRRRLSADLASIDTWLATRRRRAAEMHAGLLNFCRRPFVDADEHPLQLTTPEFSLALKDSFARTAPWYVRIPLTIAAPFERAVAWSAQRIGDARQWLTRMREPHRAAADLAQQLGQQLRIEGAEVANAGTLAREMRSLRWVPAQIDEADLERAWRGILIQLVRSPLGHSDAAIDAMTREVWQGLGVWQRTKAAVLGLFRALGTVAAIGGLVTAMVDGGATLLVSYKLSATIAWYAPGVKALLIAGGGAAGAYVGFQLRAIELNTLPYLSRFFALACDTFGVPRRCDDQVPRVSFGSGAARQEFPLPDPRFPAQPVTCPLEELQLWQRGPGWSAWERALADE